MRRRLSTLLDYQWPIIGGLASWAHCLLGDERFVRWLRTNDTLRTGGHRLTASTSEDLT